jgi:hypothetical protein
VAHAIATQLSRALDMEAQPGPPRPSFASEIELVGEQYSLRHPLPCHYSEHAALTRPPEAWAISDSAREATTAPAHATQGRPPMEAATEGSATEHHAGGAPRGAAHRPHQQEAATTRPTEGVLSPALPRREAGHDRLTALHARLRRAF